MDIFNSLGRLHLWLLHLPIGLLGLQIFLEIVARRCKKLTDWRAGLHIFLKIGVVSAVASAAAGWWLADGGGYDFEILWWHRWLGVAAATVAVAAYFFRFEKFYLPVLLACGGLLVGAGHFGGSLTHGSDFLTEPFLENSETVEAEIFARPADTTIVFEKIIQPILLKKCGSCHSAKKTKGGLRLDSPKGIQRGGENGKVVFGGRVEESEIFRRISLPIGDEKHMPPAGKRQLSPEEMIFLRWWIFAGASFSMPFGEMALPAEVEAAFDGGDFLGR